MIRVPLLDVKAQNAPLIEEIKEAINSVVDSGQFIMSPVVEELEQKIANYVGVKHCIGVSSGSDALLVSLMALEIGPGDLVIVPDYSFFATAGVVARLNAEPVFVDIQTDTYNICPDMLEKKLEQLSLQGKQVKALIAVHLFGQCADMERIHKICEKYSVVVIEDAAQALGASQEFFGESKQAGSMGLCGCFSFFPSKNLGAMGDGGMVSTNDSQFAEKIKTLRNHGAEFRYYHSLVGGNFRLDSMQAAVLLVKLKHLESWHLGRQKNAAFYSENLTFAQIKTPVDKVGEGKHIYNQYVISVREKRDELRDFLVEKNIGVAIYYPVPFCKQKCFARYEVDETELANSIAAAASTLALPIYSELSDEMKRHVVEQLKEFYAC